MVDWKQGLPEVVGDHMVGWLEASPETAGYWEGIAAGELRVKTCERCMHHLHPRRVACPDCGNLDLVWTATAGTGELYTFSEVYRAARPELAKDLPYCLGIIALDEGVYFYSRIVDDVNAGFAIGQRCEVRFEPVGTWDRLPVFHTPVST